MFQREQRCEGSSIFSRLVDLIQRLTLTISNFSLFRRNGLAGQHKGASLIRFCTSRSLSRALSPPVYFFVFLNLSFLSLLSLHSFALPLFPPSPSRLLSEREGLIICVWSKCPFWHWPRSIMATHSKQNERKGWIAGAADKLFFQAAFSTPFDLIYFNLTFSVILSVFKCIFGEFLKHSFTFVGNSFFHDSLVKCQRSYI